MGTACSSAEMDYAFLLHFRYWTCQTKLIPPQTNVGYGMTYDSATDPSVACRHNSRNLFSVVCCSVILCHSSAKLMGWCTCVYLSYIFYVDAVFLGLPSKMMCEVECQAKQWRLKMVVVESKYFQTQPDPQKHYYRSRMVTIHGKTASKNWKFKCKVIIVERKW